MEKEYVVIRPIRGIQTLCVKAKSKSEAKRLVDSWANSVEGMQLDIEWYGKSIQAIPQKTPKKPVENDLRGAGYSQEEIDQIMRTYDFSPNPVVDRAKCATCGEPLIMGVCETGCGKVAK